MLNVLHNNQILAVDVNAGSVILGPKDDFRIGDPDLMVREGNG